MILWRCVYCDFSRHIAAPNPLFLGRDKLWRIGHNQFETTSCDNFLILYTTMRIVYRTYYVYFCHANDPHQSCYNQITLKIARELTHPKGAVYRSKKPLLRSIWNTLLMLKESCSRALNLVAKGADFCFAIFSSLDFNGTCFTLQISVIW